MAFNVEAARQAGYSDAEIQEYLASQRPATAPATPPSLPTSPEQVMSQLMPGPSEEVHRQMGLLGRIGVQGITALPEMISRGVMAGVEAIPGVNLGPQATVSELLTRGGVPSPETAAERFVAGVGEPLVGGAGVIGAGKALAQAAPAVSRMLTAAPGTQALAATGAGAAQTAAQEAGLSPMAQTALGITGGLVAPLAAIPVAKAPGTLARTARGLVEPFTKTGKEKIVGKTLSDLSTSRARTIQRLEGADELIPGSKLTTAQVSKDLGLARTEKTLNNLDPKAANRFTENFAKRNLAKSNILRNIAKDQKSLDDAIALRDDAALPFLESAKSQGAVVDANPALKVLDTSLKTSKRTLVRNALSDVRDKFFDEQGNIETDVGALYEVRKHINDLLGGRAAGEQQSAKFASRELIRIRNSLDDQIKKVAPDFEKYLNKYKELSKPIDQIEMGQDIAKRVKTTGTTLTGERIISPAKWANVVTKNRDELAQVMTKAQMKQLDKVGKDLDLGALAQTAGRPIGSDTVQNLSMASLLGDVIGKRAIESPILRTALRPLSFMYKIPDEQIQDLMVDAMIDPKLAARLMRKARPSEVKYIADSLREKATALGLGIAEAEIADGE